MILAIIIMNVFLWEGNTCGRIEQKVAKLVIPVLLRFDHDMGRGDYALKPTESLVHLTVGSHPVATWSFWLDNPARTSHSHKVLQSQVG